MTDRTIRAAWFGSLAALTLSAAAPAVAQTSLFNQPLATEAPPATEAPAVAKPKPRPKPRGPVPARALTISNASPDTLTALEVTGGGKTARLATPLAANGRTTLKLPALKGCIVSVTATFEGSGAAEASDYDVCKEKTIRFTE